MTEDANRLLHLWRMRRAFASYAASGCGARPHMQE